jgi:WD40 repeat protein
MANFIEMPLLSDDIKKIPLPDQLRPISCYAISKDFRYLAIGSHRGTAVVWNVENGTVSEELSGHDEKIVCISFSKDGRHLATASMDRTAIIWSLGVNDNEKKVLSLNYAEPRSLAFSKD